MDSPSGTQGIDLLFKKLGHNIVEIRTRAVESIVSKLEHGLLHEGDLVQEKQLMVRLLEWFNFDPSPKQQVILELLTRLTKHTSACDVLVSIGGVSFLTRLRSDIDSNLRPQIDVVVDRLLHVTDLDLRRANTADRRCVYGRSNKETVPEPHDATALVGTAPIDYGYFTHKINSSDDATSTSTPPIPTNLVSDPTIEISCLRFPGFLWHSLTGTDRHVLASTGASLCSPSPHLVRNACAFLLDVIFRDFPPEIFLQRPSIVQTLLTLISARPGGQLMTSGLECLQSLAEGLTSRLHFFQDPELYCPRQGLPFHSDRSGSQVCGVESFSDIASRSEAEGSVRLERSGGDGRDHQTSSSSGSTSSASTVHRNSTHSLSHGLNSGTWNSSTGDEIDVTALQRMQMTSPHFCLASLAATLPSMKTDSTRLALNILQAISPLIHLLGQTIRSDKLWTDTSTVAQSLRSQLSEILESVGDVVLYHYNMSDSLTTNVHGDWSPKVWSKHEARMHRLVFQAMSTLAIKLLQAVLPFEQAATELKICLSRALFVIACDEPMRLACVDQCEVAQSYLEQCNPDRHDVIMRLRKVSHSFTHTHMFFQDYKELTNNKEISIELVELAESSLDGLAYHCEVLHINNIVQVISKVFLSSEKGQEDENQLQVTSKRMLLRLLAHPLVKIRRFTYEECLNIVRRAINVKAAAENPGHTQSNTCRFLLDSEVLHEICSHGLSDTSRLVSYPAQELISVLVQSRLLVANEIWLQLHAALAPVLPILQGYSGESEILKSALSSYMTATEHPDISSDIDLLKASLRGLMLKHRTSRGDAASRLQQLLNKDGTTTRISGLIDLLMVDTPLSLVPRDEADCFRIRRCIFQEEAVIRMLSVFRSLTAEASVRIGALRQLATMLDDANLHRVFLKHKGLDSVCEKLKSISADDVTILTDDVKPVVSACITIMKVIMRSDAVSRERLSHDRDLLLRLLHLANLTRLSVAAMSDVCVVIALLVFHDVLRDHVRPESGNTKCEFTELSLPAAVVARYQVPFLCPSHHAVSIHRTLVTPPSPSCDQLISGPAATALRIAWNVAEFGNHVPTTCINAVISSEANHNNGDEIISLRLSESDHLNLVFSHPDTASAALIDAIIGSQSHAAAIHVFSLMRIMTMTFHGSINFITAIFMDSSEKWKTTFGKFLQVPPSCYEDEVLLGHLTSLLNDFFTIIETSGRSISSFLDWFLSSCVLSCRIGQSASPLLKILESSELQEEPLSSTTNDPVVSSVTIRRQLCKQILSLLSRVGRLLHRCKDTSSESFLRFHRELRTVILVRLRLADAPQFYDLPSMEVTLQCLVHISANQVTIDIQRNQIVDISATDKVLLQQLLGTLLEIVSAFHIGSGASSLSYMGKGVSRCATQCILQLAREMAVYKINDWPNNLVYVVPSKNDMVDGLGWLVPLWSARDPRTRFAGLAIASAVSQTKKGCVTLAKGFQRCPGGLWSMTLCVLLDHSECSAVRGQASDLLCNMISWKLAASPSDVASGELWQGPVVQDEASETTVYGLAALQVLLRHAHLFDHISLVLARYHPNATVRSPAYLNNVFGWNVNNAETLASLQGSEIGSTSTLTPLSQASISNAEFLSLQSAHKDVFGSSLPTTLTQTHDTGTQVQGGSTSPMSTVSSLPDEWRAVVTPSLVASVCRFLTNLVSISPRDTIAALMQRNLLNSFNSLLDADHIESLFTKISSLNEDAKDAEQSTRKSILARNLITQYDWSLKLFKVIVSSEPTLADKLSSSDDHFVHYAANALKLQALDTSWNAHMDSLHKSSLEFLSAILHQNIKKPLPTAFTRHWKTLNAAANSILPNKRKTHLHTAMLRLLALLFKTECITRNASESTFGLAYVLETMHGSTCHAKEIALLLIKVVEQWVVEPSVGLPGEINHRFVAACNALQNLFACSDLAKSAAMQAGFFERCLDEIQRIHIKLRLQCSTASTGKTGALISTDSKNQSTIADDCESHVQLLLLLTSLLNNLIHGNAKSKLHAAQSKLGKVLTQLWTWTTTFNNLLIILLRLVMTYTADCEQASSSLASNYTGQPSVVSCLIQTCRDIHATVLSRQKLPANLLQLTFNVLTNISISPECRALVWKANLLELFAASADRGQHPKRSKLQTSLLEYWLRLMLALSFHTDGQLNILKLRDIFDVLIELYSSKTFPKLVLDIIRNLCFHAPSKNRISSCNPVVNILLLNLGQKDKAVRMDCSIAVLSLLCNNQKAKVHLKGAGLGKCVQNTLDRLTLEGDVHSADDMKYKRHLEDVLQIMQG